MTSSNALVPADLYVELGVHAIEMLPGTRKYSIANMLIPACKDIEVTVHAFETSSMICRHLGENVLVPSSIHM